MKKWGCDAWVRMCIQNMPIIEANSRGEAEKIFLEMLKNKEIDLNELSNDCDDFEVVVVEEN